MSVQCEFRAHALETNTIEQQVIESGLWMHPSHHQGMRSCTCLVVMWGEGCERRYCIYQKGLGYGGGVVCGVELEQ